MSALGVRASAVLVWVGMAVTSISIDHGLFDDDGLAINGAVSLGLASTVSRRSAIPAGLGDGAGRQAQNVASQELFPSDEIGVGCIGLAVPGGEEEVGRGNEEDLMMLALISCSVLPPLCMCVCADICRIRT